MIDKIEAVIRRWFAEQAGGKLDDEGDGWLFDGDSNWGFKPRELAELIAHEIEREVPNSGVSEPDK